MLYKIEMVRFAQLYGPVICLVERECEVYTCGDFHVGRNVAFDTPKKIRANLLRNCTVNSLTSFEIAGVRLSLNILNREWRIGKSSEAPFGIGYTLGGG
jgi:hypothetical protein